MTAKIRRGDLGDARVVALIRAHLANSAAHSPAESIHALPVEGLAGQDIAFFTLWDGDTLLGCGALKRLADGDGEVKAMHVAMAHRGRGHSRRILAHLEAEARTLGMPALWLETGSQEAYAPSRALYASFGFAPCAPFGDYRADQNSVFMTKRL